MNNKIDLLNLQLNKLTELIMSLGMPKFQAKNVYTWLHQKCVASIDEMTNISKAHRERLDEIAYIGNLEILHVNKSKLDGTEKFLLSLADGNTVETVLMRHPDGRRTLCVSCQVGCPCDCQFCATGHSGYLRDLTMSEILGQVYAIERYLGETSEHVTNIVYMGMGEPLLNIDNVIDSINILTSETGLNISKRRITVSTCGIIPGIATLIERDVPLELAISLHSAIPAKRAEIMPVSRTYALSELHAILAKYQDKADRRLTFEYIVLGDFNDGDEDARALATFVKSFDHIVNLIPYNPVEGLPYKSPTKQELQRLVSLLTDKYHINVTVRHEKGGDIDGACGQLRMRHMKK